MAGNYSVNTAFTAKDKMSPAFKKMGKSASMFGSILKANLVGGAISKGVNLLGSGLKSVTSEYIAFEGALISSGAKFQDINVATVEGQKQLKQLGIVARQVGATTVFSATEAAQGLDFLAMAGFSATESMLALPQITNLAVVAQTDLATATDIASDSLGAFGLEVKDLNRLNDVMAKTMTTSNTNMFDMFEAIKKGAPSFTAAGQSLESFNALLGTMANSGVKGSEAGTALRNVMLRLASPTTEAMNVMKDLNVITQDQQGNFLDVIDIIGQFEKGLEGMGSQQRTAALATVFGARTVTGMNLLLQEGSTELNKYRDALIGAGGASGEMAGVIGGSLGNKIKGLKSALLETGFTFVSVFDEQAGATIDRFTEMVRNVDLTALAIKVSDLLNSVMDNMPMIEKGIKDAIPQIKEFAKQTMIIVDGLAKVLGYGSAEAKAQREEEKKDKMLNNKVGTIFKSLLTGGIIGAVKKGKELKAIEQERTTSPNISAPNQREAEARQQVQFNGQLNIAGAPAGSTVTGSTMGAPPVVMQMLGARK